MANQSIDPDLLREFLEESTESLQNVDSYLLSLEQNPEHLETIQALFRPIHSIKGNSSYFGLMVLRKLAHEMESLLDGARKSNYRLTPSRIALLLESLDQLKQLLQQIRSGSGDTGSEAAVTALCTRLAKATRPDALEEAPALLPAQKPPPQALPPEDTHKTMRVAEEQIDQFLAYVGELLVVGDMFEHLCASLGTIIEAQELFERFKHANSSFRELSSQLQASIMDLRNVPAKKLLSKAPRMIHDIALQNGKKISSVIRGELLHIDKSHAELLDSPLVHMVRNAADHGIESPEVRLQNGKDPTGSITVAIEQTETEVVLSVSDDGKGLDFARIESKAREMGIVQAGQTLTTDHIVRLIFASGLSTAQSITDVSGRGVGMDVVKRMVDQAKGTITVDSIPGRGTTFAIRLPRAVTTQILQGYIVQCAGLNFVLPMDCIRQTLPLVADNFHSLPGKGDCVVIQGSSVKLIDLRTRLRLPKSAVPHPLIVEISHPQGRLALLIDHVVGVQKMVKRPVNGLPQLGMNEPWFDGAALRGDGSIALIINPSLL